MGQHTPGPWIVIPYLRPDRDDDPMGVYAIQACDELQRAYFKADPETPELEKIHAENLANARLIAAAPEMREFIYRIAQGLLTVGVKGEARALLAKVDGHA